MLHIRDNEIQDEGAEKIGEGISKLLNLTALDLDFSSNYIHADGAGKLGEGISKLLNLTTLDLNFSWN